MAGSVAATRCHQTPSAVMHTSGTNDARDTDSPQPAADLPGDTSDHAGVVIERKVVEQRHQVQLGVARIGAQRGGDADPKPKSIIAAAMCMR